VPTAYNVTHIQLHHLFWITLILYGIATVHILGKLESCSYVAIHRYNFPVSQVVDKIDTIGLRLFVMECVQTHQSVNFHIR
jgi:hypothetical protein